MKENISLKKKVKMLTLKSFVNKYKYIFVLNGLTLNTTSVLSDFINKNHINISKISVKSKLLINLLNVMCVKNLDNLIVKGPVILVGINDLHSFNVFLNKVNSKNFDEIEILGLISKNFFFSKEEVSTLFLNFIKQISVLEYYNLFNKKFKTEIFKLFKFSTFFIETRLMQNLKFFNGNR